MKLHEVTFPIFNIRANESITREDGIVYVYPSMVRNTKKILDNTNLPGANLGLRRIQFTENKYKLNKSLFTLKELFNNTCSNKHFIDFKGKVFKYKKSNKHRIVKYFKIVKTTKILNKGYKVELLGSNYTKILSSASFNPSNIKYLGIINISGMNILYDISPEYQKSRKVRI